MVRGPRRNRPLTVGAGRPEGRPAPTAHADGDDERGTEQCPATAHAARLGLPVPPPRRAADLHAGSDPHVDGRDLPVLARRAVDLVVLDAEPAHGAGRAHVEPEELPDDPARLGVLAGDLSNGRARGVRHRHRRPPRLPARVLRGADGEPADPQRPVVRRRDAAVGELPREGLRVEDDARRRRSARRVPRARSDGIRRSARASIAVWLTLSLHLAAVRDLADPRGVRAGTQLLPRGLERSRRAVGAYVPQGRDAVGDAGGGRRVDLLVLADAR